MPNLGDLIATHAALLARAADATHARTYFAAFAESPSTRIWGDAAPAQGRAAFDALLGKPFDLDTPGAVGRVAPEQPPYGIELAIGYPHLLDEGVDALVGAAKQGLPVWRDAGPAARTAIALEILMRINARSFEFAHAVMHTTGQAFVMAFQAGGAHAHERALEAIAYAHEAMSQVPASVTWEKPRTKGEPQRMTKTFTIVPRGVALVIGCTTFPTWNSYPGLFASLVTGNPVVVKPHPHAVLPLALTVAVARDVLSEYGFDANLVTLAVDDVGERLASALATHPDVRIIDFTGSSAYGEWLEQHATQARVFTEKSGVNCVVIDSTDDLDGLATNLAYSLALYSGQMCTTPQTVLVPSGGVMTNRGHRSADELAAAIGTALDELLADPLRAVNMLGAIVDDTVLHRLEIAPTLGDVMIASRVVEHPDFPAARVRTPLLVRVDAEHESAYAHECFGPVAFVVETENTADSLDRWRRITTERGALTASIYSTDAAVLALAETVALDCGVSTSLNLTGDIYVNQTVAFSDYHGTGANKAANASLTDLAFVADRFRIVESRQPQ
jgi:phenylacetic acid degradation protein paaN